VASSILLGLPEDRLPVSGRLYVKSRISSVVEQLLQLLFSAPEDDVAPIILFGEAGVISPKSPGDEPAVAPAVDDIEPPEILEQLSLAPVCCFALSLCK